MFRNYLYVSSTTRTIRDHFAEFAATAVKAVGAKTDDLALDIASNDGTLIKSFLAAGVKAAGVDPAENLAREANAAGLPTECAYWDLASAEAVVKRFGKPKVITAANVFAHADDLQTFMKAVAYALAPEGLFFIEAPYVVDFLEKGEFDTAYHEHLSYLGVTSVQALMKRHGFAVCDVEYFPDIHGGTVRYYCGRGTERKPSARVAEYLEKEAKAGLLEPKTYERFAALVLENKKTLRTLVNDLRKQKKTVWAYGASAKGNTLMNFFGLTSEELPIAIDDNPKKWGLFTPGAHMRVEGPEKLKSGGPDALLLLAWNFEKEIRARCRAAGYKGSFIVPVPKARLVDAEKAAK